jgi:hypothetical protein
MSSCTGLVGGGPVRGGARAGVSHWHWVGGGPGGGLPNYVSAAFSGTIHSWGNIARWIGMALRTESVIPGGENKRHPWREVQSHRCTPKERAPLIDGRPRNLCAHFPCVRIADHGALFMIEDAITLQELFVIDAVIAEDCPQ